MNLDRFKKWLRNIYTTQEDEISCTECFDQISNFVEAELAGRNAAADMPQVRQHLDQCRACREEYEALHDLRLLEQKGELPSADDLQDSIK